MMRKVVLSDGNGGLREQLVPVKGNAVAAPKLGHGRPTLVIAAPTDGVTNIDIAGGSQIRRLGRAA